MSAVLTKLQMLWNTPAGLVHEGRSVTKEGESTTRRRLASPSPDAVLIDLETRSASDIEEGGRRYAQHPTTEIMTAVALMDDRLIAWSPLLRQPLPPNDLHPAGYEDLGLSELTIESFAGPDLPSPLRQAVADGRALCAHNAQDFDRHVWQAAGLPEPSEWLDTLPHARAAGFPGKLDELGVWLVGRGKDKEGQKLLKRYCSPGRDGQFAEFTPDVATRILRYNVADVLLLNRVFQTVWGHAEPHVVAADRIINERGIAFDRELAAALVSLGQRVLEDATADVERLTDGAITRHDLGRVEYLLKWLESRQVRLPNLQKATVERFLERAKSRPTEVDRAAIRVLEARLVAARTSAGKLGKALASLDEDGRLRDLLLYHKGHTGRWAGRGVQPQNLPRPHKDLKNIAPLVDSVGDFERFRSSIPPSVELEEAISALVRPCFQAGPRKTLVIGDFASIEARGVAWCADEFQLLEKFARGDDVYCDLAAQVFGRQVTPEHKRERQVGKQAVLGCGYGMGADRFEKQAADEGVDLKAAGITAEQVVEGYRDAYPAIAGTKVEGRGMSWRQGGLWREVENAARLAILHGRTQQAGRCSFDHDGCSLVITLPSERKLCFRNARVEKRVPGYCKAMGINPVWKPAVVFDARKEHGVSTYGGELVENVVQAVCRDLLAAAMLECERQGLPIVLHVHDELVAEVPLEEAETALRKLVTIMSTPPSWAAGFPVEVEGFAAHRYFKVPPDGGTVVRGRNGILIR